MLDEGILAEAIDGHVKQIALKLQITPQRVHQIIANDPYASFMRVHRAMAEVAPERAQQMADAFNATHDGLMMHRALPTREEIISRMARAQGESLALAVDDSDIHKQLHAAFLAQRANADHIASLLEKLTPTQPKENSRPRAVGEKS